MKEKPLPCTVRTVASCRGWHGEVYAGKQLRHLTGYFVTPAQAEQAGREWAGEGVGKIRSWQIVDGEKVRDTA